jgi:hypothetical protein
MLQHHVIFSNGRYFGWCHCDALLMWCSHLNNSLDAALAAGHCSALLAPVLLDPTFHTTSLKRKRQPSITIMVAWVHDDKKERCNMSVLAWLSNVLSLVVGEKIWSLSQQFGLYDKKRYYFYQCPRWK